MSAGLLRRKTKKRTHFFDQVQQKKQLVPTSMRRPKEVHGLIKSAL